VLETLELTIYFPISVQGKSVKLLKTCQAESTSPTGGICTGDKFSGRREIALFYSEKPELRWHFRIHLKVLFIVLFSFSEPFKTSQECLSLAKDDQKIL
jgi:hypothetical protein